MEEFVYQESKELYEALVRGEEISWPTKCRNCDFEFPSNLKSEIHRTLMNEPLIDLLKLVSGTFKSQCCGHNYCCINNFKPSYKRVFCKPPVSYDSNGNKISYYIFTEELVVEEGLTDWYDIDWPDFESSNGGGGITEISQPSKVSGGSGSSEFSLFDIVT